MHVCPCACEGVTGRQTERERLRDTVSLYWNQRKGIFSVLSILGLKLKVTALLIPSVLLLVQAE